MTIWTNLDGKPFFAGVFKELDMSCKVLHSIFTIKYHVESKD